jgi:serine/threonine protein kinase
MIIFWHFHVIYKGLDYLHKGCNLPIVHRDVKTSNILLGRSLQVKIADFGLSKTYLSDSQTHISATAAGTAGYVDPEYVFPCVLTIDICNFFMSIIF